MNRKSTYSLFQGYFSTFSQLLYLQSTLKSTLSLFQDYFCTYHVSKPGIKYEDVFFLPYSWYE